MTFYFWYSAREQSSLCLNSIYICVLVYLIATSFTLKKTTARSLYLIMELEVTTEKNGSKTYTIQDWDLENVQDIEPYSFKIRLTQVDGSKLIYMIWKDPEANFEVGFHRVSKGLYSLYWNHHKMRYNLKIRDNSKETIYKVNNFFKHGNVRIVECGDLSVKQMLLKMLDTHTQNVTDLTGKVFPKHT